MRVRRITCETTRTSLWSLFGDLFSVRTKLFYNIQVQTWLNDPSLTSLDVFDRSVYSSCLLTLHSSLLPIFSLPPLRMNAVVLHEQLFADHFLMTPAARYSLGQSLRVALITPLIDKFTVTQVEGKVCKFPPGVCSLRCLKPCCVDVETAKIQSASAIMFEEFHSRMVLTE